MTTKLKLLSREDILGADDRTTEVVEVPEWGGAVRVRTLSGLERDRYMTSLYTMKSNGQGGMEIGSFNIEGSALRLLTMAIVDDEGNRVFSEEDLAALGQKNGTVIDRIEVVAKRLSSLNKTIDQVKKDLGVAQNGSSGSV